jgi:hypothetical protein
MVHEFERLGRGEIASEHLQSLVSPSLEQQLGSCIYLRVYEVTMGFFFKHLFSLSNMCCSFSQLKRILTSLMIIKEKALEIGKNSFKIILKHIYFKCVFDSKTYEI